MSHGLRLASWSGPGAIDAWVPRRTLAPVDLTKLPKSAQLVGGLVAGLLIGFIVGFLVGVSDSESGDGADPSTAAEQSDAESDIPSVGLGESDDPDGVPDSDADEPASVPVPDEGVSGLPTMGVADLPAEGRATLALISVGGPYPYDRDDATFFNREGLLPAEYEGYYREYTVDTPGSPDRGARRLVVGDRGDVYYTADHYDSFVEVVDARI